MTALKIPLLFPDGTRSDFDINTVVIFHVPGEGVEVYRAATLEELIDWWIAGIPGDPVARFLAHPTKRKRVFIQGDS